MRKSLIMFAILASLLLFVACQPEQEVVKEELTVEEPIETLTDVDGDAFAEIEELDISDLEELENMDEELKELEGLEI